MKKLSLLFAIISCIFCLTSCKTVTKDISCYDVEEYFNIYAQMYEEDGEYWLKVWCEPKDDTYIFGGYIMMFGVGVYTYMINPDRDVITWYHVIYMKFDSSGYAEETKWFTDVVHHNGIASEAKITSYKVDFSRDSYVGNVTYKKKLFACA